MASDTDDIASRSTATLGGNPSRSAPTDEPPKAASGAFNGEQWRSLLRLAWPMMLTQFFIMATGFIDTVMAGRASAVDLAGVTLGGNLLWPFFMLLTGVTMALTPIVSQLSGARQVQRAGARVRQALWFAGFSSLALVLLYRNAAPIYATVGIQGPQVDIALGYLEAASWGVPAIVFYVALRQVCEGLGQVRLPMVIAGLMVPINGLLNYTFIYGKFGFPALGGVGCGWATALVFWFELLLMIWVVRRPFFAATLSFERWDWPNLAMLWQLLRIGLPIGLAVFLEIAVFSVMGLAIGRMGVTELAANSVAGSLNWLTYVLPAGLGAAASIRVGYFVGAKDYTGARSAAATAFVMALIYGVLVSVLLVLLRVPLASLYTNDPAVMQLAASLVIFVAIYQIVDDTNAVAIGALRGYKDTQVPMLYGLFGFWFIAMPLGTLLAFGLPSAWQESALGQVWTIPAQGVYGYWQALTLGLFIVALMVSVRLLRTSRDLGRIERLANT